MKKTIIILSVILFITVGCNNKTSNEKITALTYQSSFGTIEKGLVIESDSIHFVVMVYSDANHYSTNNISAKTPVGLWDKLMTMCDINTFRKIKPGRWRDDEANEEFMLSTKDWVMFFTNGDDSKYYKKQKKYFDVLKIIASQMENKLKEKATTITTVATEDKKDTTISYK